MRTLRSVLVAAVAPAAAVLVSAAPAAAAPPVGCYGFPSIPDAFLCVTSFTPENAVPGASLDPDDRTVTIPAFCAGECYGPFDVDVPGADFSQGSGQVAVVVYKGTVYPVVVNAPTIPTVPSPGGWSACPGYPLLSVNLGPYVCAGYQYLNTGGSAVWWTFGTCLTAPCATVSLPADLVYDVLDVVRA